MSVMCRQCGWPYDIGKDDGLCPTCRKLKTSPDGLSKRTHLGKVPFQDMKQMDEVDRIKQIIQHLRENPGKRIAVMVDTGEGHADKGDRYIKQVRAGIPSVELVSRAPGPVPDVETITFKYKGEKK